MYNKSKVEEWIADEDHKSSEITLALVYFVCRASRTTHPSRTTLDVHMLGVHWRRCLVNVCFKSYHESHRARPLSLSQILRFISRCSGLPFLGNVQELVLGTSDTPMALWKKPEVPK